MKNTIAIILCFICSWLFAQHRFVYRIDFKIDSLNRNQVDSELFNLDTDANGSLFYAQTFAKWDSIYRNGGSLKEAKIPDPKLDYFVTKDYTESTTNFRELLGMTIYEVQEPRPIQWTQMDETDEYLNYKVRKATTKFAGREWEAWFTNDIPINDGPYKFKGLPGMILKVIDRKSDYDIYLVEIKKIEKPITIDFFSKVLRIRKLNVDYATYQKKKKELRENPALMFVEMGVQMSPEEMKKFSDSREKIQEKNNNTIELAY